MKLFKRVNENDVTGFETRVFHRLVFTNIIQYLVLSITGIVDCTLVGMYCGTASLANMKLAMPIFSIISLIDNVVKNDLSIVATRKIVRGEKEEANHVFNSMLKGLFVVSLVFVALGLLIPEHLTAFFTGPTVDLAVFEERAAYLLPII